MKLLKPHNLNLEKLIVDDKEYSYITYTDGRIGYSTKHGKLYRKLIPEIYYFVSQICMTDSSTNFLMKDMKRIKASQVDSVLTYKKLKQVVHFLTTTGIIKVKSFNEFVQIPQGQILVAGKYYQFTSEYQTAVVEHTVQLNTKASKKLRKYDEDLIKKDKVIAHQYKTASGYTFNHIAAMAEIGRLKSLRQIDDVYAIKCHQHIEKLMSHDVIFSISLKNGRITTMINTCPRVIRKYFLTDAVELDFSTFNIQVLIKLIDENIVISNIDKLQPELKALEAEAQLDFYQHIVEYFKLNGVKISREEAKENVLYYWLNAQPNSKKPQYKILKHKYPNITELIEKLKGDTYTQYCNFINRFMKIESELINKIIYKRFIEECPEAIAYNIYDGMLVEKQYAETLQNIMEVEANSYFKRKISIKRKK